MEGLIMVAESNLNAEIYLTIQITKQCIIYAFVVF